MNVRRATLATLLIGLLTVGPAPAANEKAAPEKQNSYTVAVYYWPGFHRDPFTQKWSNEGEDWTEWDIMRTAKPEFEGHYQPKEPLRGYYDESDPKEMAKSIDEMADAGIGAVIFDWYRYDYPTDYAMRVINSRPNYTGVSYFPQVSVGWDGTPRNYGGALGTITESTPEQFGNFLEQTKTWLDQHPESKGIMTINSWNEWPEGSYVEPDKKHGTAYLDKIRRVFGNSDETHSK